MRRVMGGVRLGVGLAESLWAAAGTTDNGLRVTEPSGPFSLRRGVGDEEGAGPVVARVWRGRVRSVDAEEYVEYVRHTGIPAQRGTPGNLAALVLTREEKGEVEIVVLSLWESMDAVRVFAGPRPELPVYFAQDAKYLLELEPEVQHFGIPVAEVV